MTAPTNGTAVLDRVRAALAEAQAAGRPRPGRPTLRELTGATDHQVKRALAALAAEPSATPPAVASAPTTSPPAVASEVATPATPPHRDDDQDTSPLADQPRVAADQVANPRQPVRQPRPWPLILIGLAAAVAVWGGWVELGRLTGFGVVHPLPGLWDELTINTAIVLPLGIEAYGGYALRTWLSSADLSERTRRFARWSAIASLLVGAGAQVANHLMKAASVTSAPPLVTVLVACVPVLVLGLATGLATLVKRDLAAGAASASGPLNSLEET